MKPLLCGGKYLAWILYQSWHHKYQAVAFTPHMMQTFDYLQRSRRNSCTLRMAFFDFLSAFNTIQLLRRERERSNRKCQGTCPPSHGSLTTRQTGWLCVVEKLFRELCLLHSCSPGWITEWWTGGRVQGTSRGFCVVVWKKSTSEGKGWCLHCPCLGSVS